MRRNRSIAVSKLKKPKRTGYKFVAWYSDKKLTKPAKRVRGKAKKSKRTLYAKWKLSTYKITYELSGGAPTITLPASYTVKSPTINPFAPTRDGYRFAGWYKDAAFKTKRSSIAKGSTGKVKLYAKWVPASYWNAHLAEKCAAVNALACGDVTDGVGEMDYVKAGAADDLTGAYVNSEVGGTDANGANGANGANAGDAYDGSQDMTPLSFVFITDTHLPSNALVSPWLVKQVLARTDAQMIVFGGDAINFCSSKQDALDMLRFACNAFADAEVHFVRGNHDANTNSVSATAATEVSDAELLAIARETHEVRDRADQLYCYRDDDERRVRLIFLDSGAPDAACVDDAQLDWMAKRIAELDETWTVIIFIHQFFSGTVYVDGVAQPGYDKNGLALKARLDALYDSVDATIAGVITGHCHKDYAEYSDAGYPIVSTTTDAYAKIKTAGIRKLGTVTEQAFDVVTLDTTTRTLHFTRIGAGEDRAFSYGTVLETGTQPVGDDESILSLQAAVG